MSRRVIRAGAAVAGVLLLAGCAAKAPKGVFAGRSGPNEFVVGRAAPLVVPPDFALVPPRPGQPRPQEADSSTQALNALFGGQQRASAGEQALLRQAGPQPEAGIRSEAGSPATTVVNKGVATRDILAAPVGTSAGANASTTAPAAGNAQGAEAAAPAPTPTTQETTVTPDASQGTTSPASARPPGSPGKAPQ